MAKYAVVYTGEHLFDGQTPLGTQVEPVAHPDGGGKLALKRADGQYATVATFSDQTLGFKVIDPPGSGEAFYDAGNQYINIDGNGQPHAFLKSGTYGQ